MSTHGNYRGREARLNVSINPDVKAAIVASLEQGESLADRIERVLALDAYSRNPDEFSKRGLLEYVTRERPKEEPLPRWTRGLNRRTAECLVKAGYNGKVSVRRDASAGFDHLPNWGRACTEDLYSWL